jgi:DNA-binding CsgD family transcriptional regulator
VSEPDPLGAVGEDPELDGAFAAFGLDRAAVAVYRGLLSRGSARPDELSADGIAPEELGAALSILAGVGLIARDAAVEERYTPVAPDAGLRLLNRRREGELTAAALGIQDAYRTYQRQVRTQGIENLVEVVTGPAILQRIKQAEDQAQHLIRRLDSPPYYRAQTSNETEIEQLARGIGYRVVYAQASLARENYLDSNIIPCIRAGEQARVLANVPVKLSVIDDALALVSLSITDADVNRTLLIVRPSTLFSALVGLFDLCWQSGLPILPSGVISSRIEPVERRMLGLLASGMSDEEIVRTLRISRRTFFRYLEKLQARAGVGTRFQLGVYAAQQGWLAEL